MTYVICYDITENKIRNRAAEYLKGIAYRIQYSLFMAELDEKELEKLKLNLSWMTKIANEPLLMIVPVCKSCKQKMWKIGETRESHRSSIVV